MFFYTIKLVINGLFLYQERSCSGLMARLKTRQQQAQKCEKEKKRFGVKSKDPKERERKRRKSAEARKKKKIEIQLLKDEILYWKEKAEKWKNEAQKHDEQFRQFKDDNYFEDKIHQTNPQNGKKKVIVIKNNVYLDSKKSEETTSPLFNRVLQYLEQKEDYKVLIRIEENEFLQLVAATQPAFDKLTWRGTPRRRNKKDQTPFDLRIGVFLTLHWMAHYPTLGLLHAMFKLHTKSITRIIKRTTIALHQTLQHEIRWPSEQELTSQTYSFLHNDNFYEAVCVVDGSEIRISRPSNNYLQIKTYSKKKKQHSLNVMFITNLVGKILYFSPHRIGAHDQSHWNELGLRQMFENKRYGIMGDGGFKFNRKRDILRIHGFNPYKKPKGGKLTRRQKRYNRKLSQMRVVVENAIRRVKKWKVLGGVYRHFRLGRGKIDLNHVLTIAVTLSNREIIRRPLRSDDYMAPDWQEEFAATVPTGPDPN